MQNQEATSAVTGSKETKMYESETYYKFNYFAINWVATCGVMNYCHDNKCKWILDVISSYVLKLSRMRSVDYMLIVEVALDSKRGATFTISQQPANDEPTVLIRQTVEFTDLQHGVKFWAINESADNYDPRSRTVLMLPEEY